MLARSGGTPPWLTYTLIAAAIVMAAASSRLLPQGGSVTVKLPGVSVELGRK